MPSIRDSIKHYLSKNVAMNIATYWALTGFLGEGGGTIEITADAQCFVPIHRLEVIFNGRVVASRDEPAGAREPRESQDTAPRRSSGSTFRFSTQPKISSPASLNVR